MGTGSSRPRVLLVHLQMSERNKRSKDGFSDREVLPDRRRSQHFLGCLGMGPRQSRVLIVRPQMSEGNGPIEDGFSGPEQSGQFLTDKSSKHF